ncbi:MAG: DUF1826 domain-containing protein [Pseudomonadota bacterium]
MSLAQEIVKDAALGVAVVDAPQEVNAFLKPGNAATIWRRQPVSSFQSWIDRLAPEHLPQGRIVLRTEAVRTALTEFCALAQTPESQERERLIDDVTALAHMFAELMEARYLRLRLQAVTSNACRKFHVDAITARLVCTYRGAGTQYGVSTDGTDPSRVFAVATGAPILLRGSLWPEEPASGLLHRSPPIEGTGETRLVLVLDPIFDLEEEE